ncbi:MAG: methyltransferase [Myxococcota bacterium]
MTDHPQGLSPEHHVLGLLAGKWVAQAISSAAALGVPDALEEAPLGIGDLARRIECDALMLERLLAVLVGEEILTFSEEDETYGLTEAGLLLCSGEDRLRDLATFIGSPSQWAPWSSLADAVRAGTSAFERTHGLSFYDHLEANPSDAAHYDEGVDRFTTGVARAVAKAYDFSAHRQLLDIGGGLGTCAYAILDAWPQMSGTILDRPHVVSRAQARGEERGLAGRCACVVGDFFAELPAGADLHILKHILHNWADEDAHRILERSRAAIAPGGTLLLVEGVLHPGRGRSMSRLMDLEMMVLFGHGRARSKRELQLLLRSAGWTLDRTTHPLDAFARLLIARPR